MSYVLKIALIKYKEFNPLIQYKDFSWQEMYVFFPKMYKIT